MKIKTLAFIALLLASNASHAMISLSTKKTHTFLENSKKHLTNCQIPLQTYAYDLDQHFEELNKARNKTVRIGYVTHYYRHLNQLKNIKKTIETIHKNYLEKKIKLEAAIDNIQKQINVIKKIKQELKKIKKTKKLTTTKNYYQELIETADAVELFGIKTQKIIEKNKKALKCEEMGEKNWEKQKKLLKMKRQNLSYYEILKRFEEVTKKEE